MNPRENYFYGTHGRVSDEAGGLVDKMDLGGHREAVSRGKALERAGPKIWSGERPCIPIPARVSTSKETPRRVWARTDMCRSISPDSMS